MVELTAVETGALVEHGIAHGRTLHVMEITGGERLHGLKLFFGIFFKIFVEDAFEGVFAEVLVGAA